MELKYITNSAYQRMPRISHSLLANAKQSQFVAYMNSPFNQDRELEKKSDALAFGSLYHTLIQFPEIVAQCDTYINKFNELTEKYLVAKAAKKAAEQPVVSITTRENTIHIADFGLSRKNKAYDTIAQLVDAKEDDLIVNADEFTQACQMINCLTSHPVYQSIHAGSTIVGEELTLLGEIDGIDYKVRFDRLLKTENGRYICIDWKTTKDFDMSAIRRGGQKMCYDLQDELYRRAISMHYGVPMSDVDMVFIFQCKEYPLLVYAFKFTPAHERRAKNEREALAAEFMERFGRGMGMAGFIPIQTEVLEFSYYENALEEYVPIL